MVRVAFAEGRLKAVGGTIREGSNSFGDLAVELAEKLRTEVPSRRAEKAGVPA